jgi:hypothetical protein
MASEIAVDNPSTPLALRSSTPRFSRLAIAGFICLLLAFLGWALVVQANYKPSLTYDVFHERLATGEFSVVIIDTDNLTLTAVDRTGQREWKSHAPRELVGAALTDFFNDAQKYNTAVAASAGHAPYAEYARFLLVLLVLFLLSVAASVLGLFSFTTIRRSQGTLRGKWLALLDAWCFPPHNSCRNLRLHHLSAAHLTPESTAIAQRLFSKKFLRTPSVGGTQTPALNKRSQRPRLHALSSKASKPNRK